MDKFYKHTINEGIKLVKSMHFGTDQPTEQDLIDYGAQHASVVYGFVEFCIKMQKSGKKYMYICDPEWEWSVTPLEEAKGKKPDSNHNLNGLVVDKSFMETTIIKGQHDFTYCKFVKYNQPDNFKHDLYGIGVYDPMASGLLSLIYFK